MARLFFAIALPESIEDELDGMCEGIPQARWALETGFHITLSFLDDVPSHRIRDAREVADSIRHPPLDLRLEGAGVFPNRGQPRVLWIGVRKNDDLFSLQRILQNELRHAGFQLEKRKFHPHVTLARLGEGPREAVSEWLAHHLTYQSADFRVTRFHLISSTRHTTGSRYTIEHSVILRRI